MAALILFIIFGVVFAYFATLNTQPTSVAVGTFVFRDVPVYLVVISAFAVGLLVGGFFSVVKQFIHGRVLHRQSDQLSKAKQETVELTKQIHQLELENAKLKTRLGDTDADEESL